MNLNSIKCVNDFCKLGFLFVYLLLLFVDLHSNQLINYSPKKSVQSSELMLQNEIPKRPSYVIFASKYLRSGHVYKISATIFKSDHTKTKLYAHLYNGQELISTVQRECAVDIPQDISLVLPSNLAPGNYRVKIETNWNNDIFGKNTILGESSLMLEKKFLTILILVEKPIFKQDDLIKFKLIALTTDLTLSEESIDVCLRDANGNIVKKWISKKMNSEFLNFEYPIGDQVAFGRWTIEAFAQQFVESTSFLVKEHYSNEFEVYISLASTFQSTDPFVFGSITANFSNGIPVCGNVTLYATIRSSRSSNKLEKAPAIEQKIKLFNGFTHFRIEMAELAKLIEENSFDDSIITIDAYVVENDLEIMSSGFTSTKIVNRKYNLKFLGSSIQTFRTGIPIEVFCLLTEQNDQQINHDLLLNKFLSITPIIYYEDHEQILYTRQFMMMSDARAGVWQIKLNIFNEIDRNDFNYIKKIILNATYLNEDYHSNDLIWTSNTFFYENNFLNHSKNLSQNENHLKKTINAQLFLMPYTSTSKQFLKVWTTTSEPQIGENIIFHVRANFHVKMLNYILMTKNILLTTGRIIMEHTIKTFFIRIDKEMSPASTILVYCLDNNGEFISDSIYFPVNLFLRVNRTSRPETKTTEFSSFENYFLNTKNSRQLFDQIIEETVDSTLKISNVYQPNGDLINNQFKINVFGEQEQQIALTAVQSNLKSIYPRSQLSKIGIQLNLLNFENIDLEQNYLQIFHNKDGLEERLIQFATPNAGVNSNQIFKNAGLLVFTDVKKSSCNSLLCSNDVTLDEYQKKCLIKFDKPYCNLESNKSISKSTNKRSSMNKRNFILNHFSSNWLWKDIRLDSKGQRTLNFNVLDLKVPSWSLTAFSLTRHGLNLVSKDIELYMIKPIQMKLRYPKQCVIGEHLSVQINVVNYLSNPVELMINIELNDNFNFINSNNNQYSGMNEQPFNLRLYRNLHENVFIINAEQTSTINFAIEPKKVGLNMVKFTARTSSSTESLIAEIDVKENAYQSYYIENIIIDLNEQQNLIQYLQPNTFNNRLGNSLIYESFNFYLFKNCLNHLLPIKQLSDSVNEFDKFTDKAKQINSNYQHNQYYQFNNLHQSINQPNNQNRKQKNNFKRSLTRLADENVFNFGRYLFTIIYINKFKIKNLNTKLMFRRLDLELQSILSFQNQDGGFRRFKLANSLSNVRLTAFILKMFTLANQLDYPYGQDENYVEQNIIDRAALFLINYQTNQGVFKENLDSPKKFNYSYANNNENNLSNEIELTTFVLIALNQLETSANEKRMKIDFVKKKSVKYLNSMLEIVNGQEDPYTLSILTYCLNLFKTDKAELAYSYLAAKMKTNKNNQYFWSKTKENLDEVKANEIRNDETSKKTGSNEKLSPLNLIDQSRSIQATAYALLTQLICNGFIKKEIVNWLNSNLQITGDYLPTYDVILAAEAILAYLVYEQEQKEYSMNYLKYHSASDHSGNLETSYFDIEIENHNEKIKLNLDKKNKLIDFNSTTVKNSKDIWLMKASGNGFGILQVRLNYALSWTNFISNQIDTHNNQAEQLFTVRVNYYLSGTNYSNLKLEICLKNEFKLKNRPVMLKFRLPTSFSISQNQLNSMVQDRLINNLKEATFLTEDTVVFIFDKLDNYEACVPLSLQRVYLAANINPYILFEIVDLDLPKIISHKLIILHELNKINICDICGSYTCSDCPVNSLTSSSSAFKRDSFSIALIFWLLYRSLFCKF